MPNWGDNIDWDSGAHWSVPAPPNSNNRMSIIAINVRKLALSEQILKGQDIITKSTENPDVPGNAAAVTAFSTAQTGLETAVAAEIAARTAVPPTMSARETARENWLEKLTALASFTQSATGGDMTKIESAGFSVRPPRTPPQPLPAPTNVKAKTNGTPGHTALSWGPLAGAKSYVVQISPDPITANSWEFSCNCTMAHVDVNGADPGQRSWYRVAGVNAKGQGPWSEPASRPVM